MSEHVADIRNIAEHVDRYAIGRGHLDRGANVEPGDVIQLSVERNDVFRADCVRELIADEYPAPRPLEVIDDIERIRRIISMLHGNKAPIVEEGPHLRAHVLDGKVYYINRDDLQIWDYFEFRRAMREGVVPTFA